MQRGPALQFWGKATDDILSKDGLRRRTQAGVPTSSGDIREARLRKAMEELCGIKGVFGAKCRITPTVNSDIVVSAPA